MSGIKALLLDLSGVVYEGTQRIEGAVDTIKLARAKHITLRFVTNTATKSSAAIVRQLLDMGIPVHPDELYTAPIAAFHYLKSHQLRPYLLIHQALLEDFSDLDLSKPNCVLLGDARDDLTYQALNDVFRLCIDGAPLIGIGKNKYFRDDDGLCLDAGAFIHAIEWAAGIEAIVMGKPSTDFFNQVVASTGFSAEECLMVGDDVQSDVLGALDAGLRGCLVKTGKYRPGDENQLPDDSMVIPSIHALADIF